MGTVTGGGAGTSAPPPRAPLTPPSAPQASASTSCLSRGWPGRCHRAGAPRPIGIPRTQAQVSTPPRGGGAEPWGQRRGGQPRPPPTCDPFGPQPQCPRPLVITDAPGAAVREQHPVQVVTEPTAGGTQPEQSPPWCRTHVGAGAERSSSPGLRRRGRRPAGAGGRGPSTHLQGP